ncbi:hypothetical protein NUSPORA_01213 [Nucleospora cyclopteri]
MTNINSYAPYNLFSPEGKLFQLQYAQAATEMGNTSVALTNGKEGVLIAHSPRRSSLCCKKAETGIKITKINDSCIFSVAGITNDGLFVSDYLHSKSLEENITKNREIHPIYVFDDLCSSMAYAALTNSKRLCGAAGILMCEFDGKIRISELQPNSRAFEVRGTAIGNRNQACKTVLEKNLENFSFSGNLIKIALEALLNAHPEGNDKSIKNQGLKSEEVEIYTIKVGEGIFKVESSEFIID